MESLVELSRGLQIASDTAQEVDEFPKLTQQGNMGSGCNNNTNRENTFDAEITQRRINVEETETECISDCEILDYQYWEQLEPTSKLNHPRKARCHDHEEQKILTYRKVFSKEKVERKLPSSYCKLDKPTTHMLEKLLDVRSLEQYQNVIGKGKNSVVISAGFTDIKHHEASYCVSFFNGVKIYQLSKDENFNKAIYKQTANEFENISRLRWHGLRDKVPYPVCYNKNILVMSMIGTLEEPAQQLNSISPKHCQDMYDKIVTDMKRLFYYNFVHGKLCAEHILIWHNEPFYVGWSHSVWKGEPSALKKLMKDCYSVTKFFKRRNVPVMPTEVLFKYVSEIKEISPEVLDVIHNKEPHKVKCHGNPNRARPSNAPSRNCRFK